MNNYVLLEWDDNLNCLLDIIFLKFSLLKLLNDRSKKVKEKMVMNTILKKNKIFAR